jgi:DNA-binding transcriptional LysR family regulator
MAADQWEALELRHLRALQVVARTGAIGRAALELGYTQSAISQQLAALERAVGARLFERGSGRRDGSLTSAGRLLLGHADAVLGRLQAARIDMAHAAEADERLRIGGYASVGARVLPTLLARHRHLAPDVELHFYESARDDELWDMVEAGDLDLAFALRPVRDRDLETTEMLHDPYVLVAPAASPVTQPPTLEGLYRMPLISYRSCPLEHRIESQLHARGIEPNIVFRADDNRTIQGLVGAGHGVAAMPLLAVDLHDPAIRVVPVGELIPPRVIGLIRHRDRHLSHAVATFMTVARETCAGVADELRRQAAFGAPATGHAQRGATVPGG